MFKGKTCRFILLLCLLLIISGCGTKTYARQVSYNNESIKTITQQTPKAEPVDTTTPVNIEIVTKNETIYSNYLFSPKELSKAELTAKLGIPVDIQIVDKEDNNPNKDTIPYRPSNDDSNLKKILGKPVIRQSGEKIYSFAKRVAVELRSHAKIGISYMVSADEEFVYKFYGNHPVMCSDLAVAFAEIMRQNGVWANLVEICISKDNRWDAHTTVEIYDPEMAKWIIVDPMFAGVFRNKQGNTLNAGEIQADRKNARFVPFVPSAGYDHYYIEPLSKLYGLIVYKGSYESNYLQIISGPNSPYKFPVEKIKVNNGFIYLWRSSNQMAALNLPGGQRGLNLARTLYRLNLANGEEELKKFVFRDVSSIKLVVPKDNPKEKFLEVLSNKGGGLVLNPQLTPGKIYIVNVKVSTNTEDRKLYFSYQDNVTKQWSYIEGKKWKNISYMVIPGSPSGSIYLYHDVPTAFDIKDISVYEIGNKL